jgi:hypothetical protein
MEIMTMEMKIIIEEIPENEGGGFEASVEGMRFYLLADGDSPLEALKGLASRIEEECIEDLFEYWAKRRGK